MIWVVLDSNIYVSALVFGGNPRTILELAEHGLFGVSVSHPIKADVERVAHPTNPQQTVSDCIDPDDNRILECALEARAQAIVTGDNHLLKLHPYGEISILTPKQFLDAKPWQS